MSIPDQFKRLVRDLETACKSLGWTFEPKWDGEIMWFKIDQCPYYLAQGDNGLWYLAAEVLIRGGRWEPDSSDEQPITNETKDLPYLSAILDAHWSQRKEWAIESTLCPEDL